MPVYPYIIPYWKVRSRWEFSAFWGKDRRVLSEIDKMILKILVSDSVTHSPCVPLTIACIPLAMVLSLQLFSSCRVQTDYTFRFTMQQQLTFISFFLHPLYYRLVIRGQNNHYQNNLVFFFTNTELWPHPTLARSIKNINSKCHADVLMWSPSFLTSLCNFNL